MGGSPLLTAATTFHSDKTFYCNGRTHSRHRLSIIARFLVGCEIMVGHSYFSSSNIFLLSLAPPLLMVR